MNNSYVPNLLNDHIPTTNIYKYPDLNLIFNSSHKIGDLSIDQVYIVSKFRSFMCDYESIKNQKYTFQMSDIADSKHIYSNFKLRVMIASSGFEWFITKLERCLFISGIQYHLHTREYITAFDYTTLFYDIPVSSEKDIGRFIRVLELM